jgi:hypothetical protein
MKDPVRNFPLVRPLGPNFSWKVAGLLWPEEGERSSFYANRRDFVRLPSTESRLSGLASFRKKSGFCHFPLWLRRPRTLCPSTAFDSVSSAGTKESARREGLRIFSSQ